MPLLITMNECLLAFESVIYCIYCVFQMLVCNIFFFFLSGLCEGPVTGLTTVERDTDSHRPLMSDEEEEEEDEVVCDGGYYSIQKQDDEPEPQTKAIGFFQAFCLPGVLPVGQILNVVCYQV